MDIGLRQRLRVTGLAEVRRSVRAAVVDTLGRLAARSARAVGRAGGIIGGRTVLALDREALGRLSRGRATVLVSGTNGKTTTTAMIARAVASLGPIATNRSGANMPDGLVAALLDAPAATVAVLEVDEAHLPRVVRQTRPHVVALLNLSRDQLDRSGEVHRLAAAVRDSLAAGGNVVVVANPDDVLVTSAAFAASRPPVWVQTGAADSGDSAVCPRCSDAIRRQGDHWWCVCGLRRPAAGWRLDGDLLTGPAGETAKLTPAVPGRMNAANAAVAAVTATAMGVPLQAAAQAVSEVAEAAGRYRTVRLAGHWVRLLLAKNPAGWIALLDVLTDPTRNVVVAVDGRQADGADLSWLWDVPFERLRGRQVVACGGRAADLSVCLTYAGVEHRVVEDPMRAIGSCSAGDVDLAASYSCFVSVARSAGV